MKFCVTLFIIILSTITFSQFRTTGEPVRLTGGDGNTFLNPKWSPDGRTIAVSGANYKGIYLLDESGKLTRITDEDAAGFGYSWSNDSKSILTRVAKYEGAKRYNAVKLFDVEKNSSQTLSDYNSFMPDLPQWSSDNTKIYFYNNSKLEVHNSGKISLMKSASGSNIFIKGDRIFSGDIERGEFTKLDPLKEKQYLNMSISPDQSKIAFEVYGGNLYVMNADGSNLKDLGKGYRASWSPDSKYVVYMITEDDGHQFTSSDLYISSADGIFNQQLTFTNDKLEMDPDWSPEGTRIVYDENTDGAVYSITITKN